MKTSWPPDLLKEYLETILEERDTRYEEKFAAKSELAAITDAAAARAIEALDRSTREFRKAAEIKLEESMPRKEYEVQHKALQADLQTHILNETDRAITLNDRVDGRFKGVKEDIDKKADKVIVETISDKQDSNNKWLLGMVAAVVVAIILTSIDLIIRLIGG